MLNNSAIAERANQKLYELTQEVVDLKNEFHINSYYQTFTKNSLAELPNLTTAIVNKAMNEMENAGYIFAKKQAGSTEKYALTVENVIDIYAHRGFEKYRSKHNEAFTIFVGNLKGGVSKTVSCVSVAHALRTHKQLIKEDLRILVIDLDPQSSATMFLNHKSAIGSVEGTAAQAMLQNVSRDELLNDFIVSSIVACVDVMPASIEDAFLASSWEELCAEHLPNQNIHSVLRENIIEKIKGDYDFILIDCGPHLDALLTNSLAAADLLLTPVPPSQVDFHSTLKYLARLPELTGIIEESGYPIRMIRNIGFMSKLAKKTDHQIGMSYAKEVFQADMLDAYLPRSDAFERVGESFDTIISCDPSTYAGSADSLKKAREATENFAIALFDRVEMLRAIQK